MDTLAIGSLLALMSSRQIEELTRRFWRIVGPLSLAGLLSIGLFKGDLNAEDEVVITLGLTLIGLSAGWLVFELSRSKAPRALQFIFSNPALVWVGLRSYSIYLVHQPIVVALLVSGATAELRHRMLERGIDDFVAGSVALFVLPSILTILVGWMFWWLTEVPAFKLRRRLKTCS